MRGATLTVIRIGKDSKLMNSKPCKNCIAFMKKYSIKNVAYSNSNGIIVSEKIKEIKSNHISKGWK